jgi:ubiquinone/menaquinone biosynthesis C-methylase UbiE
MPSRRTEPPAYDSVAGAYGRTLDPDGHGLADPAFEELLGDVSGREVLSLACGQGQDARLLARLGASVTGVDLSERMLAHARRHEAAAPRGITYVRGDAHDLSGFADASFDGVACHMALMDIPRLSAAIRSVARVLRPGGWFVFSVVHPCYRGHVEIVDDYLTDHLYAKQVPVEWLPPSAHHRPLAAYVNELAAAGFRPVRMVEADMNRPSGGDVPQILYLRSVLDP